MTEPVEPPAQTAPPKADPETLVLRAAPGRVTRFRRSVIVAIAAAGLTAIVGVAWLALKPATLNLVAAEDDRPQLPAKAPADALAGAPTSYGDVPQLGAPLPGDLGRPILNHQRSLGMMPEESADDAARRAAQAAEAERQRIAAEQRAARESGVMLQLAANSADAQPVSVPAATSPELPPLAQATEAPDGNGQQRRSAMIGRANDGADVNPHRLTAPVSPWTLQAGSVIAGSLITGLNSDLPGFVTAQVTENVYDSVTGRILPLKRWARNSVTSPASSTSAAGSPTATRSLTVRSGYACAGQRTRSGSPRARLRGGGAKTAASPLSKLRLRSPLNRMH